MTQFADIKPEQALPERRFTPTNAELFVYNAAIWNPHRIHYDREYATAVEGYPAVVIDGPLQGDWLTQVVTDWMGETGTLLEFKYSNRKACYLGETLTSGGTVTAVDPATGKVGVTLFVRNEAGEITSPGEAVVQFPTR